MKKILLSVLVFMGIINTANATKIISKEWDGNGYKYTIECNNGKWISISQSGNVYQGLHKMSLDFNKVISSECKQHSKISGSTKYGYVKKGALLFKSRKGDGSIEWALTPAPKGKVEHMSKVILDSILEGSMLYQRIK